MKWLPRLAKALRIILINCIVFFCFALFLEAAFRVYSTVVHKNRFFRQDTFTSPWITTYDYPPPKIKPDGKAYFRHEDAPTPLEKPANTIRIIAVGGSTTVNRRPYEITRIDYPKSLEGKLTKGFEGMSFEVLNAGGDAYSTAHTLVNLQFRLAEFKPDIVLLMHNINDSSVNVFKEGATSDYANKYIQPYYLNPSLQRTRSFSGFLTQSRLLAKLGLTDILVGRSRDLNPDNDYSYGLYLFKRNLSSIARICKQHDIDLVLLSQPYTLEPHRYIPKDVFLVYGQAVAEVAKAEGVHFVDMFLQFGHDKKYFVDEFHYSPEGIERFTDILYSELSGIIAKKRE